MNRFRRVLIRWEKKVENYVALLHFARAWITFRATGVFGSKRRSQAVPSQHQPGSRFVLRAFSDRLLAVAFYLKKHARHRIRSASMTDTAAESSPLPR
jgi:hypothetical protein